MALGKEPPIQQKQLARELLHLRSIAGLDQREVATRIGVSQATVSRVERAEKLLPLPKVRAWAEACEASQEVLDTLRLTNYTGRLDEAAALAGRWRRQEALTDHSRRFDFLLPESVLRWSPAGPDVLAAQLDRVATQENVSVGVIRDGQELVLPLHGFTIYADRGEDDPFVSLELAHTYLTLNHPTDVAFYRQLYQQMATSAAKGADAAALIRRAVP